MVRKPVVAGQFYPGSAGRLEMEVETLLKVPGKRIDAVGAISPHAAYVYSGSVAGEVFGKIEPQDTYIILSPNHTGHGKRFSISPDDWETPLGRIETDAGLVDELVKKTKLFKADRDAHLHEHSVEVQLPFIQVCSPGARIVAITVQAGSLPEIAELSQAISSAVKGREGKTLILASSDMTHYESRESASRKDQLAIHRILDLDPEGLLKVVVKENITMCGYMPAAIMLSAAKKIGARKAELVRYIDSGDVSGNTLEVVGYAGVVVF